MPTIIIASALPDTADFAHFMNYSIQGYLVKPLNLSELHRKILHLHGTFCPDQADTIADLLNRS